MYQILLPLNPKYFIRKFAVDLVNLHISSVFYLMFKCLNDIFLYIFMLSSSIYAK